MKIAAVPALAVLLASFPRGVAAQRDLAGATRARLALEQLSTTGSVLMIAAHPDDENTALLAWLARGRKVRTGYLSLTRGEGGQNLIGSEQDRELGLIRTQELLAARRIDGAEQFFTRAVDFGFSKTAEETLERWGHDRILSDVVWVIRKFRPDVIVLRFSGTPRDGHGNHQASALLGKEAYTAAADPSRFPEQLREVQPWKAKRLMWNVFAFTREQEKEAAALPNRIEADSGEFNPALGYSYAEIAGMSRSQHESQGMGAPERRGPQKNFLVTIAGEPAKTDILDGVQTQWESPELAGILRQAVNAYTPEDPGPAVGFLLKALPLIKDERRQRELQEAIALCTGLWLDATSDAALPAQGASVKVMAEVINRSKLPMELQAVEIGELPSPLTAPESLAYNKAFNKAVEWKAVSKAESPLRELPQNEPILQARFLMKVQGTPVVLSRPVRFRYVDPVRGEMTRPLVVVPRVSLEFSEKTLIFPDSSPRTLAVQLRSYSGERNGFVRLRLPDAWKAEPAQQAFSFTATGQERTVEFKVTPPARPGTAELKAVAEVNGEQMSSGVRILSHSHIPPITLFPSATASLVRTDAKVLSKRIGYVMGAGDRIPDALRQLGCEVTMLSDEELARGELSRFDAIVTGVRAYNVRADLRANQGRLLDYVTNGGTVVVQYNVADPKALDRIGPYPIKVTRDRVTVEEAPVEFLGGSKSLFSKPNQITAEDFKGWVQERGLYFASEWDPKYEPVISCHDPGEKSMAGGMLYTKYGKGVYVFTAYSWFRQLPAGVPGAYRIFANLISAGRAQ